MTPEQLEHQTAMQAIGFAYQVLEGQRDYLARLIEAERGMHSFLHITDPTQYIRALHSDNLRNAVALAKAAQAFLAAVDQVRDDLPGGL